MKLDIANIFEKEADRCRKIMEFANKHDCYVIIPLQSKKDNESEIVPIKKSEIGPIKVNSNPTKYRIFI